MLMPRASCIAIYDRNSVPLWMSDGSDGRICRTSSKKRSTLPRATPPIPRNDGREARAAWSGETAYVFIPRGNNTLLGALGFLIR